MDLDGVSALAGALALAFALALIFAGQWKWPTVIAVLMLTGVMGLFGGTIGGWLRRKVRQADAKLSELANDTIGVSITGVAAVFLIVVWALLMYRRVINAKTMYLTAAIPLVLHLIPGKIGTAAIWAIGIVPWAVGEGLMWLWVWD